MYSFRFHTFYKLSIVKSFYMVNLPPFSAIFFFFFFFSLYPLNFLTFYKHLLPEEGKFWPFRYLRPIQTGNFQKDMISPLRCFKLIPFKLRQWILIKLELTFMSRGKKLHRALSLDLSNNG